jgi:chromosome segregation ATPase
MSDSSELLNQLTVLYGELTELGEVCMARNSDYNQANNVMQEAQGQQSTAQSNLAQHDAVSADYEARIAALQNEKAVHDSQRSNLEVAFATATQLVNDRIGDMQVAQTNAANALATYNAKRDEVNALKARIKAEVDDDFPT